jgi:hypothetical protein
MSRLGNGAAGRMRVRCGRVAAQWCLTSACLTVATPLLAQSPAGVHGHSEVLPGSVLEEYLRAQALTMPDSSSGGIRPFGGRGAQRITGPWSPRFETEKRRFAFIAPNVGLRYNSAYPYAEPDGPLWAGRGMTFVATAGFKAQVGMLSLKVAPVWFRTANRDFRKRHASNADSAPFADLVFPATIDLPSRFGDGPYSRLDVGETTLLLRYGGVEAGGSTATEAWGPATRFNYILSTNAGGFPRLFAGTARALPAGIGRIQGRVIWGRLSQSPYSVEPDSLRFRYASAAIVAFQPRGLTGLELGAARFFHDEWPGRGFAGIAPLRVFEGLIKAGLPRDTTGLPGDISSSNQLASVFARWGAKNSEAYAEFGREDHSFDRRDLLVEPDHIASLSLGFARAWGGAARTRIMRMETISYSANRLTRHRFGPATYVHTRLRQGHTYNGQQLGANAGTGSGRGAEMSFTSFHNSGATTLRVGRRLRYGEGATYRVPVDRRIDALYWAGIDRIIFAGAGNFSLGASLVANVNRDFERDEHNINLRFSWQPASGRLPSGKF